MLSVEENEALTHVGPGTVMGDLLRQYWVPALLSEEVPGPDCPPVRLRLLCENLIALPRNRPARSRSIQDACPHRARLVLLRTQRRRGHPLRLPRLEVRHRAATASTS